MAGMGLVQRTFIRVQCKLCDAELDLFRVDGAEEESEVAQRIEQHYGTAALEAEKVGWKRPFAVRHRYRNIHETWMCQTCVDTVLKGEVTKGEHCARCGRSRPTYITDPTCSQSEGGYCEWVK